MYLGVLSFISPLLPFFYIAPVLYSLCVPSVYCYLVPREKGFVDLYLFFTFLSSLNVPEGGDPNDKSCFWDLLVGIYSLSIFSSKARHA